MAEPVIFTSNLIKTLYYALYAKYGNSSIASSDQNQFKMKLFLTIFEYGPAWADKLRIQEKLFNLDLSQEDFLKGTTMVYNHAANPDTTPSADSFNILPGVNSQNTSMTKRGKLEGYALLAQLIETDVTEEFLGKFKKLFLTVVMPQAPLWYQSIGNPDELTDDALMVDNPNNSLYGNYRTNTFQEIWEDYNDFYADYESCGIPMTI